MRGVLWSLCGRTCQLKRLRARVRVVCLSLPAASMGPLKLLRTLLRAHPAAVCASVSALQRGWTACVDACWCRWLGFVCIRYSHVLSGAPRAKPASIVDFVPVGFDLDLLEVRACDGW